jgi:hemerythrin superfamily protein
MVPGTTHTPDHNQEAPVPDVIDLIMQDHREFERMLDQLANDPEKRPDVLPVFITLITAHSRAEEAEVYPPAAAAGAAHDVEHSQEEHVEADELLAQLAATDPASAGFEEILAKVDEAVRHHLGEEEETVLPKMRELLSAATLQELADAFAATRAEHLGERPADITKAELEQQAANADVPRPRGVTKEELQQALRDKASS